MSFHEYTASAFELSETGAETTLESSANMSPKCKVAIPSSQTPCLTTLPLPPFNVSRPEFDDFLHLFSDTPDKVDAAAWQFQKSMRRSPSLSRSVLFDN